VFVRLSYKNWHKEFLVVCPLYASHPCAATVGRINGMDKHRPDPRDRAVNGRWPFPTYRCILDSMMLREEKNLITGGYETTSRCRF
ncbi:MAG TPA: hypothetical protein VFS84_17685, partial [Candidatus Binatia bacterium]|nr:hypothetical protein [Candidatus Binatia bacterium]